ncbi:hypothetical protein CRG98_041374 [Punica granatum]|uniref:Uncharacterized protein n=1 Tax=Punica granatum TaxID=22663 RepID=A0A2I0I2M3_PUNGR|nr:hypothetical protein CRG98_041374 [Punica granatum]
MDLYYVLREEEPLAPTDTNAPEVKEKYEWWEKSNRLSLMLMKSRMSKSIRGAVGEVTKAKDFLKSIKEQFAKSNKALASTLMKKLTSKTFDSSKELLTMCVQEEERMKHDKPEVAHLATRPKGKGKKDHGKRHIRCHPRRMAVRKSASSA